MDSHLRKGCFGKDLFYVVGTGVATGGLGGLFWFVVAGVLDVEIYGMLSYLLALGSTLAVIGSLGLGTAVTTFVAKGDKEFARDAFSLTLLLSLISGVAVAFLDPILGLYVAAAILFSLNLSHLLGKRKYLAYSFTSLLGRGFQVIFSLVLFFALGFIGLIIGYSLALLLASFNILASVKEFRFRFRAVVRHKKFVIDSFGTNLLRTSSFSADKILIASLFGFSILGSYTISSQFFLLLSIVPSMLFQYLLPESSAGISILKIKRISLLGASTLSVIGFLVSPLLITMFFPKYADSILLSQVIILALTPYTYSAISRAELFANERSRIVLKSMLLFVLLMLFFQAFLGSLVGTIGLGYALVLAYSLEALYLWLSKKTHKTLDSQKRHGLSDDI